VEVGYDLRFEAQAREYSFRFTCEHCAHFDERTGRCVHGFPDAPHRSARYEGPDKPRAILFCKDFDLA